MAKTFLCTVCKSRFGKPSHLARHTSAVHEKLKPFRCTKCKKKFARKDHFDEHVAQTHKGQRLHACPDCPLKFTKKLDLQKHSGVHTLPGAVTCSMCKAKFRSKAACKVHMGRRHAVPGPSRTKRASKRKGTAKKSQSKASDEALEPDAQDNTPLFDDLVAAEVKLHAQLYDRNHQDYGDEPKRDDTWTSIGKTLGKQSKFVRDRWTKLKRNFAKEVKRAWGDADAVELLKTEHKLAFLLPFLKQSAGGKSAGNEDGPAQLADGSSGAKGCPPLEDVADEELQLDLSSEAGSAVHEASVCGHDLEEGREKDVTEVHPHQDPSIESPHTVADDPSTSDAATENVRGGEYDGGGPVEAAPQRSNAGATEERDDSPRNSESDDGHPQDSPPQPANDKREAIHSSMSAGTDVRASPIRGQDPEAVRTKNDTDLQQDLAKADAAACELLGGDTAVRSVQGDTPADSAPSEAQSETGTVVQQGSDQQSSTVIAKGPAQHTDSPNADIDGPQPEDEVDEELRMDLSSDDGDELGQEGLDGDDNARVETEESGREDVDAHTIGADGATNCGPRGQ